MKFVTTNGRLVVSEIFCFIVSAIEAQSSIFYFMNLFFFWVILMLGAYLIGSFPTGYLVGVFCGIDIRQHGSSNIGATNVVRVLGKKWGYAVFVVDCLKGFLAVFLASRWNHSVNVEPLSAPGAVAALAVLLGHNFPIWLKFKGGKGMATSVGIMLGLFPGAFFVCLITWVIFFYTTRYVSLASIAAAMMLPIAVAFLYVVEKFYPALPQWLTVDWLLLVIAFVMALLAILRHRKNIERLLAGTELRF